MSTTRAAWDRLGRWGPEITLALLAGVIFLGFLGSVELWGKREQRASAEAIDTVDHHHWLVARIQGRPRLEKPPLPRWTVAALITLTGRRDEWLVRLPGVLSALGMVGLVHALGCRIGGRSVGLSSALMLTSMGFFIVELRQAGNDGPLAFFTTLALHAAWRRLHAEGSETTAGARGWNLVLYAALGLGFLCKGPVVVMIVAVTVVPYLACARRLRSGLALLIDAWGLALFVLLVLSWPVPVLLNDPNAARIWMLEMGQKAGLSGISHGRQRLPLVADWPGMVAPWGLVALMAAALPFLRWGTESRPRVWFPWWWAFGNLAIFCLWSVAKPNYYLPCLPGAAILCGLEWVRMTRAARASRGEGLLSRLALQTHWVALFVVALIAPVAARQWMPELFTWAVLLAPVAVAGVLSSAWFWRRGRDAEALAPLVGVMAVAVLLGYGVIAPAENHLRSHRALAATIDRSLPADARTVMFFHELDEGLWFYLRGRALVAVPGSQPDYNDAFQLAESVRKRRFEHDARKREESRKALLMDWLRRPDRESSYLLIRDRSYDQFAPAFAGLAEPSHRESGLKRNGFVLLRASLASPQARMASSLAGESVRRP
ncbi:MAG: hypothetical protein NVSMB9_13140 [Isosphaeraceae bacterium]